MSISHHPVDPNEQCMFSYGVDRLKRAKQASQNHSPCALNDTGANHNIDEDMGLLR